MDAVQTIMDLMSETAIISVDLIDVQTALKDKGIVQVGMGVGKGENKAIEAIKTAIASPFSEKNMEDTSDLIIHLQGDVSMFEAADTVSYIQDMVGPNVNIIWGVIYDESELDTCRITVIATGTLIKKKEGYYQEKEFNN